MNQVHGHEVMNMMMESKKIYTRESLIEEIHQKFGQDLRFFTCSSEGLTPEELIDFLRSRGKFTEKSDGFCMVPEDMCRH